jgi:hypothetical protein
LLAYVLLSEAFGPTAGLLSSFAWLVSLPALLEGGNLTEEFSLPVQFLSLLLVSRYSKGGRPPYVLPVIGACLASCFMLRPNNIGVQIGIVAYLLLSDAVGGHWRRGVRAASVILLSAGVVLGLICFYLWVNSALGQFLDAVFRFNSAYSNASLETRFLSLWRGFRALLPSGIPLLSTAGWVLALVSLLSHREADRSKPLLVVALLVFPIELALSSLSGRAYDHYFILWLPVCAVLTGYLLRRGLDFALPQRLAGPRGQMWSVAIGLAFVLMAGALPVKRTLPDVRRVLGGGLRPMPPLVDYIQTHTRPDDYVLIWGAEAAYNFLSDRASPTRFVYQYPLYSCDYRTTAMVEELQRDVMSRRPLLVDTSPTNLRVPPIEPQNRSEWYSRYGGCALLPPMDAVVGYFDANYQLIDEIEPVGWYIYSYHGESPR